MAIPTARCRTAESTGEGPRHLPHRRRRRSRTRSRRRYRLVQRTRIRQGTATTRQDPPSLAHRDRRAPHDRREQRTRRSREPIDQTGQASRPRLQQPPATHLARQRSHARPSHRHESSSPSQLSRGGPLRRWSTTDRCYVSPVTSCPSPGCSTPSPSSVCRREYRRCRWDR